MIFPFKTEEEAIHLANITDFGLSAAVWSRDLVSARRVAGEIESGMVFINDFTRSDPRAPFGGFKASGYGRELGAPGALELTNPKLIWQVPENSTRRIPTDTLGIDWTRPISSARENSVGRLRQRLN